MDESTGEQVGIEGVSDRTLSELQQRFDLPVDYEHSEQPSTHMPAFKQGLLEALESMGI